LQLRDHQARLFSKQLSLRRVAQLCIFEKAALVRISTALQLWKHVSHGCQLLPEEVVLLQEDLAHKALHV
jgi:hypothetical protein